MSECEPSYDKPKKDASKQKYTKSLLILSCHLFTNSILNEIWIVHEIGIDSETITNDLKYVSFNFQEPKTMSLWRLFNNITVITLNL